MKIFLIVFGVLAFLFVLFYKNVVQLFQTQTSLKQEVKKEAPRKLISKMKLTSSVFQHNSTIPAKYTCDGENVNPPLAISEVSTNAKRLVLIMDDPDAPSGTWVHWVVFNIDPKTVEILENSVPKRSIEGVTSFGKPGYGGPCPPALSGTHRYFFKLYALNTTLNLKNSARKQDLEVTMDGHILAKAELIGLYKR